MLNTGFTVNQTSEEEGEAASTSSALRAPNDEQP
jgi:hypothetical protein